MKKTAVSFTLISIFIFVFFSSGYATRFNLRFSGGPTYLSLKSTNAILQDWELYLKKYTENQIMWQFLKGTTPGFHLGMDFEGEITAFLSPRWALGISTGYIYGELSEKNSALTLQKRNNSFHFASLTTVSAFPLTVCGYYFLPINKPIDIYTKLSGGVIWAQYAHRRALKKVEAPKYEYQYIQKASAHSPVLTSGLGIMYEVDKGISFFTEVNLRYARVNGFKHKGQKGKTKHLFYFEEYIPSFQIWQSKKESLAEKPKGENFRSVREGVVDFSGLSVKIGFMIQF